MDEAIGEKQWTDESSFAKKCLIDRNISGLYIVFFFHISSKYIYKYLKFIWKIVNYCINLYTYANELNHNGILSNQTAKEFLTLIICCIMSQSFFHCGIKANSARQR